MLGALCGRIGGAQRRAAVLGLRKLKQVDSQRSLATARPRVKDSPPQAPPPPSSKPPPAVGGKALVGGLAALALYWFQGDLRRMAGVGGSGDDVVVDDTGMRASDLKNEVEALGKKIEIESQRAKLLEASKAASRLAASKQVPAKESSTGTPTTSPSIAEKVASEASVPPLRGSFVAQKPGPSVDYSAVREAIASILDEEEYDDGSVGPLFVRLAWHSAGTFDKSTGLGGTEGACMRFGNESSWGANAGLGEARARLEPIKTKFPDITYSDLWSLAGTVALENLGGPDFKWRPGRKDFTKDADTLPDGLLPDADGRGKNPADHLRDIFGRMGFDDREIVALSGAHALGRCHTDRSGFWGPWTRAPTTLSNEYFRLLLEETWSQKRTHQGKEWKGPLQYENAQTGADLMMLETDLALVSDPKMKPFVEAYAADEELFMKDFAQAWIKLQELGVRRFHGARRYYFFGPRE